MSDRTYVYFCFHPDDLLKAFVMENTKGSKFRHNLVSSEYFNEANLDFHFGLRSVDEVNYGGASDFEKFAAAGLRFYGWHGAGHEYPATDFFSIGDGQYHDWVGDGHGGRSINVPWQSTHEGGMPEDERSAKIDYQVKALLVYCNKERRCVQEIRDAWEEFKCTDPEPEAP